MNTASSLDCARCKLMLAGRDVILVRVSTRSGDFLI
jgi:hypothetical protein